MSFSGDLELGNTPTLPANPTSYLSPITSAIAAPLAFANLEGTLTNVTYGSKCGASSSACYAFKVPPSFAHAYRSAGFTVLNSANNHSHDFGSAGVSDTSNALKAAGIAQTGLPGQMAVMKIGTIKVAVIGFAPYSNTNDLLRTSTAIALIHEARTLYKASVVVVYMHAGAEGANAIHVTGSTEYFYGENRGNAKLFAETMISNGASLVVASGPHVLRGMEIYKGHLIDYSMGDFANYKNFALGGNLSLSGILRVTLKADGSFVSARFLSVRLVGAGQAVLDASDASAHLVATVSKQDFGARAPWIAPNGNIVPPAGSIPK